MAHILSSFLGKKIAPNSVPKVASYGSKDRTLASVKNKNIAHSDDATQRYLPFSEIRDNVVIMKD